MRKPLRHFILFLFSLSIVYSFALPAFAHPGKTDGSGGHTDRSTGEYHYHHGYSAHEHYDMNSDGVADCPYNIVDKTAYNGGSSTNSSNSYSWYSSDDDIPPETVTVYRDRELIKEMPYTPVWIKWSLAISSIWIICLLVSSRWKKQDISALTERIQKLEEDAGKQKKEYDAELCKKADDYLTKLRAQNLQHADQLKAVSTEKQKTIDNLRNENKKLKAELHSVITSLPVGEAFFPEPSDSIQALNRIEIPKDVYFTENRIPVKGIVTDHDPFGEFTVFTMKTSAVYHSNKYCSGAFSLEPVHLYDVIGRKRPCHRCGKNQGDTPPKWYTDLVALRKCT